MKRAFTVMVVCLTHQLPIVLKPGLDAPIWDQTGPGQWTMDHDGMTCVGVGEHDFMVTAAWDTPHGR